jgi:hypothetical protein
MTRKVLVASTALLLLQLTGCCRFLGICTSASVHTSISPARSSQYAALNGPFDGSSNRSLTQSVQPENCTD